MNVIISKQIEVSVSELVKTMSVEEVADLLEIVANKFDGEFGKRKDLAGVFAENISEVGARFLAEVCASTIYR